MKSLSFIGASLIGAVIGGLFHIISNKPENKIEIPEKEADNINAPTEQANAETSTNPVDIS